MKRLWNGYLNLSLAIKITIALVLGIITGLVFGEQVVILEPLGALLMRLLNFIILPLIFFTLIVGVNQTKLSSLGRMGGKIFVYYIVSSGIAIMLGLLVANLFKTGNGLSLELGTKVEVPENPGFTSVLLNIVPTNIVTAFTEMNLLGIIFTAIVFGMALSYIRTSNEFSELGETLYGGIRALNEVALIVMKVILQYLPVGIFAIIAQTVGTTGFDTLASLGGMVGVLYIALLVQLGLYIIVLLLSKVPLRHFFSQARTPMITAFVTQSSTGTLPLTLNAAKNLGISRSLYSFSLPFGATINMDGASIRIAVSAVFAANMTGLSLGFPEMLQIVLIGTLASIGTAGVPGAGIIMIATVFAQLGLPLEVVGLLTAVDALIGMGATSLNVTGDLVGTAVIDKTEKTSDKTAAS